MGIFFWLFIVVGGSVFALLYFRERRVRTERQQLFGNREDIDLDKVISDDPELSHLDIEWIKKLWSYVGEVFSVPPQKIRLDDRFGIELREALHIDGELTELDELTRRKVRELDRELASNLDFTNIRSVREYLLLVGKVIRNKL